MNFVINIFHFQRLEHLMTRIAGQTSLANATLITFNKQFNIAATLLIELRSDFIQCLRNSISQCWRGQFKINIFQSKNFHFEFNELFYLTCHERSSSHNIFYLPTNGICHLPICCRPDGSGCLKLDTSRISLLPLKA